MQPDPKAAEDFATLVLVTARTLRKLIQMPLKPALRAALLTELNDALAPFDEAPEAAPLHEGPVVFGIILAHDPYCKSISGHDAKRCDCSLADHTHDSGELPRTPGAL